MPAAAAPRVTLRPVQDSDLAFLARLYASTRTEELARTPWSEHQKRAFLAQQFHAQHTFYTEQFADAQFSVLLIDGEPGGRLYVHRRAHEVRIIDIALLPAHRGKAVGTRLLRRVMEDAASRALPVTIHVERSNRARSLYRRLGFQPVADQGPYVLLRWAPCVS